MGLSPEGKLKMGSIRTNRFTEKGIPQCHWEAEKLHLWLSNNWGKDCSYKPYFRGRVRWVVERKVTSSGFVEALESVLASQSHLGASVLSSKALPACLRNCQGTLHLVLFLNHPQSPGRFICLVINGTVKDCRLKACTGQTALFYQESGVFTKSPGKHFVGVFPVWGWNASPLITLPWDGLLCCHREGRRAHTPTGSAERSWNWKLQRACDWDFMVTSQQTLSNYHHFHLGRAAVESYSVWLLRNIINVGRSWKAVLLHFMGTLHSPGGRPHTGLVS